MRQVRRVRARLRVQGAQAARGRRAGDGVAGPLHALTDLPDVRHELVIEVLRDRLKADLARVLSIADGIVELLGLICFVLHFVFFLDFYRRLWD